MLHPHEIISNNFFKGSQDQSFHDVHIDSSCESLLTILDDKNKLIDTLKKQVENQKVQLAFYLKKEMSPMKIAKFSESCSPEAPQESIAINLAMANFNRQMGIKSNILSLYEHMCYIDERISNSLEDQEFILRKIVNKLCEFVKQTNGNIEFQLQFGNFITDPFHIELFNKLLSATLNLKKKLDTFRICCNRLIIIEDERNAIVEQIYTLPADQRMNCNYLVSVQMEKVQLENELQQIIKDQRKDQERIRELNVIEERLSNLQFQLNSTIFENDDSYRISQMLQEVNSEARILLELTKQQRKKYEMKLARVREKNLNLERVLVYIKLALENREPTDALSDYSINSEEDCKIFESIKKEIDYFRSKLKCKVFDELQAKRREIEMLKNKLSKVMLEKNELRVANGQLKRSLSDMKFNHDLDTSSLKDERDMYKRQVYDLEAIREAYAQLVHKQPISNKVNREYLEQITDRDDQIYELEKINMNLTKELKAVKNTVDKQNREIKQQAGTIEDLKQHPRTGNESEDKNLKYVYKNTNSEMCSSIRDVRDLPDYNDTISYVELYKQEIYVEEKVINWIDDGGDFPIKHNNKPIIFTSKRLFDSSCTENDIRERKTSTTHFKVLSSKIGPATDILEAVVQTSLESDLQGTIKKTNSSAFCLEINQINPKTKERSKEEKNENKSEIDEFELMKDCSQESLPKVCHSKKRYKETCFQQRFSVIDDNIEY